MMPGKSQAANRQANRSSLLSTLSQKRANLVENGQIGSNAQSAEGGIRKAISAPARLLV
jgi:hypothetical protein